jgi:hypothetical protein
MACHVEKFRTDNPRWRERVPPPIETANHAGSRMENCQHQHGDENEYDGRYGKIDRFGREAGSAGVVSHGSPSPILVRFPVQFRWPDRRREQVGKRPGAWPGPDRAEANGLLLLLARLFVGGLRTARILTLLLRTGRILGLRLRAARVLGLLLRVGRLRGFVGALLWI